MKLSLPPESCSDEAASGLLNLSSLSSQTTTTTTYDSTQNAFANLFQHYPSEQVAALELMARQMSNGSFPTQLLQEAALAAAKVTNHEAAPPVRPVPVISPAEQTPVISNPSRPPHPSEPFPLSILDNLESSITVVDGKERYVCPTCKRTFTRLYNLKSHIKTHANHRPYECEVCSMRFTRNHDLNRHSKIHSREKSYTCGECGRSFARRDALKRHQAMNEDGKKHHCNRSDRALLENWSSVPDSSLPATNKALTAELEAPAQLEPEVNFESSRDLFESFADACLEMENECVVGL